MPNFLENLLKGLNFTSKEGIIIIIIIIIIIYGNNIKRFTSLHGPKNCLGLLKEHQIWKTLWDSK